MRNNEMILYRNFKHSEILEDASYILSGDTESDGGIRNRMNSFTGALVELAESHGYSGNLWQAYLTYLIANNENAYSTSCEITGNTSGTVSEVALHDFAIFREMFSLDLDELDKLCGTDNARLLCDYKCAGENSKMFNRRIRDRILELRGQLAASASDEEFAGYATAFYKEFGVGKFGLHKAFRIRRNMTEVLIEPITNIAHDLRTPLTSIIGYLEILTQKKDLPEETRNRYIEIAYTKSKKLQQLIRGHNMVIKQKISKKLTVHDVISLRIWM